MFLRCLPCVFAFAFAYSSVADEPDFSSTLTQEIEPRWENAAHGSLLSLALSPDGKILASAGTLPGNASSFGDLIVRAVKRRVPTGGVQLRRTEDGQVMAEVNNLLTTVRHVAFSADGKTLAIACGSWTEPGKLVLIESATGKILTRLSGHSGWVHKVAFSPNGKQIISWGSKSPRYDEVRGGEIRLWDAVTGEGRRIWYSDIHNGCSVAYSPDGQHFATVGGDRGLVTLWDANTLQPKFAMDGGNSWSGGLVFSPDGKTLVARENGWGTILPHRYDARLIIWDVLTGQATQTVNVTKWWPERRTINFGELAFSPDGKLLAVPLGSWNRGGKWAELKLLNVEQPMEVKTVFAAEQHHPAVSAVFSDRGRLLIAAFGSGEVRRWRVKR
ncbi:WD40 repeat domain-containing protein [Novipirellula sp. SH528]|uniref:WD40 repeat domain-containing protein n=1 Tax=Novipirellula sp. SH528 TaxID=3454466 RepID=UPI003FA11734